MNEKRGKEDYLRVMYELEVNSEVKSIDIARKLDISKASVSEMIRKLAKEKLVNIKPYSKILLTKKGKEEAEKLYLKNNTIKNFIQKYLGHNPEKAAEEAHNLEHDFSEDSIEAIKKLLDGEKYSLEKPNYVG